MEQKCPESLPLDVFTGILTSNTTSYRSFYIVCNPGEEYSANLVCRGMGPSARYSMYYDCVVIL